jgi:hypothetical protein
MAPSVPAADSSDPDVLTRDRAAEFLRAKGYPITAKRLAKLAHEGGGPIYRRWGSRVIYKPPDLLTWAEARASDRKVHSCSQNTNEAA